MNNPEELKDVTEEMDVSEAVDAFNDSFEEMMRKQTPPPKVPIPGQKQDQEHPNPEDMIKFVSMDTYTYYISREAINWNETAKNTSQLSDNLFIIRKMMNELIFNNHNERKDESVRKAFEMVLPFIQSFGFDPTENYKRIYPECDDADIALMYCIDAIEIMNRIMEEIRLFESSSGLISSLFATMTGNNDQITKEEHSDEN